MKTYLLALVIAVLVSACATKVVVNLEECENVTGSLYKCEALE